MSIIVEAIYEAGILKALNPSSSVKGANRSWNEPLCD
jgi:predicted DNA-binding antitoxin AbrB/MazE fold protein